MKRPEMLNTVTVEQTRQKYRDNQKVLEYFLIATMSGLLEEVKEVCGEFVINQMMTEVLIQQEYIREREKANWGWDKQVVDFSKHSNCIF